MKALILGGSGMLGHKVWQTFADRFDTTATVRQSPSFYARYRLFDRSRLLGGVSAEDFDSIVRAVARVRPDVVVNCIGLVKQIAAANEPVSGIAINALFPHRLAQLCGATGSRLIHLSTDCVFSGRGGNYREDDPSDAEDLYGRTKFLGEVAGEGCLTVRTSIIGRELEGAHGLIEWFLGQEGQPVRGYKRAIFSGLSTNELAEILARIIADHPALAGVWHVAAEPISKFDLLCLVKETYGLTVTIEPDETVVIDRSLNADRFRAATGLVPASWPVIISRMYQDPTPYRAPRRLHAD